MTRQQWLASLLGGCALAGVGLAPWWISSPPPAPATDPDPSVRAEVVAVMGEPLQPIPLTATFDKRKVALGNRLFYDPRLSHDNSIACAGCHSLSKGGTDQRARSVGIGGALGGINAPTVFNSGLSFKQFWDGRAETLEDQIEGPTQHPKEMGSNWPEIIGKLRQDPNYVQDFGALYPEGIQRAAIKDAIATFERSLLTPNSRFDQYLRGDRTALTSQEQAGYRLFKDYGCVSCHQGVNVGGNMFQVFGVMGDYFADRGTPTPADQGRYNLTGHEHHRHAFKVPSLRNIALTAPYFHDGSAETLEDAVKVMAKYQLGRALSAGEVKELAAFLRTLTGEYKGRPL